MLYICDLKGEWVDLIYTGARFSGWGPWPVSTYAMLVIVRQTHTVSSIFVYILVLTHLPLDKMAAVSQTIFFRYIFVNEKFCVLN